jgi:GGDEF domain-containing protein
MTGLFNRHRFESEPKRVVGEANRYGRPATLLMMDLEGFKDVNDHHGHQAGDELVSRIAAVPRNVLLATRILEATRGQGCITIEERGARMTASIGVMAFDSRTGLTGLELVTEDDIAMYDAKSPGRNRHVLCDRSTWRREVMMSKRHGWMDRKRTAVEVE